MVDCGVNVSVAHFSWGWLFLEDVKASTFDHLVTHVDKILFYEGSQSFLVFWRFKSVIDLLNNEDAMWIFNHALHDVLSLKYLKEILDEVLKKNIRISNCTYLVCSFNAFFKDLLWKVLDCKLDEVLFEFFKNLSTYGLIVPALKNMFKKYNRLTESAWVIA